MKELSIEQKAKRYDDLLVKLQEAKVDNNVCDDRYCCVIDDIVPELKESEDERIRGNIIATIHLYYGEPLEDEAKEMIAWLEKQGERKSLDDITKEVTKDKDAAISFFKSAGIINENGELADEYKIEQGEQNYQEKVVDNLHNYLYGEQKPTWSEEDKKMSRFIGNAITADDASTYLESKGIQVIDAHVWLNELKDRVQSQPQQEWSEEDESLRRRCIGAIDMANLSDYTKDSLLNWLKSLKDRVQLKQEWSEEDEICLRKIQCNIEYLKREDKSYRSLEDQAELYEELHFISKVLNDLKSPQNTWKPSEEQLDALWSATEKYLESDNEQVRKLRGEVLESLYNELKKLRNE